MAQTVLYIIIGIILAEYLLERILHHLNEKNWQTDLPDSLKGIYQANKYKESRQYDKANSNLSFYSSTFNTLVILLVLYFGGFVLVDEYVRSLTTHPILMALLFFASIAVIGDLINLPFSLYSTFVIEERFDFNRTSIGTFLTDKLKGYLLAILVGGGLLAAIIWFYLQTPVYFWLWAWLIVTVVTLFFTMFYTSLIVPLFNKLTPLQDGELRSAIEQYCDKVDFPLKNIYVMDSSKRTTKANAFFSGIGKKKSIVLFDTLVEKHSPDELVAVLAHEVGHYKKKHIYKSFLLTSAQMLVMLLILSWFIDSPVLARALGAEQSSFHLGLLAFTLLYSPISTLLGILMNVYSRKNEYEADAFAKATSDAQALGKALKKLSVNHLSNLHPHPAYVFFHYSHPPLLKRLEVLDQ